MKTILRTAIAAAVITLPATVVFGSSLNPPKASAAVEFVEPERFTDFKTSWVAQRSDQVILEEKLREHISADAGRLLPAGLQLQLRFRDIDMAGDFEPWRGSRVDDARILRDRYPPSLKIEYAVTDAEGRVLASGERRLLDLAYQMRIRPFTVESTDIEAELVTDFLRDLGRELRKAPA